MNDDVKSVLNDLIETSFDGEKGFAKAAEDAHDDELKTLFTQCAQRCREGIVELQSHVQSQGGRPDKSGTAAGALHRGWLSVKEAFSKRDDKAILEECERGEDFAKAAYKKALAKDLPADIRAVVERQYQGVIANHDRVRDLRDRYRAMAS
jgi:uncharacterized protein (TIGR02284 family)